MRIKLLLLFTVIGLISCTIKRNVPIENIDFIPTINDFADYYDIEISPQDEWESNKLYRFMDGSYILEYEFNDDEASLAELQLYYNFELEYLESRRDVEATMQENITIYGGYDEAIFGTRLRHDLALACDHYYLAEYYLLEAEDETAVITMLVARKNNMVVTFTITSNDIEYEHLIDGFFNTYLQRLESDQSSPGGSRQI